MTAGKQPVLKRHFSMGKLHFILSAIHYSYVSNWNLKTVSFRHNQALKGSNGLEKWIKYLKKDNECIELRSCDFQKVSHTSEYIQYIMTS